REEFCRQHDIDHDSLCIGLLPGSRKKEIASLLPLLLQTARRLQERRKEKLVFLIPVASTISVSEIRENGLDEFGQGLDLRLIEENRYDMMASCHGAVVVSGTVTLEMALLDTPMVVIYKVSPGTYYLGRMLISKELKHFSLVNLIAGKEVVSELFQAEVSPERVEAELSAILFEEDRRARMLQGLELVRQRMGEGGASARAAELALSLMEQSL
ncbi:MAG: lipid-A-disaccharide synthase, partial [Thermodesulfobacteriota bacterium]